jgi:hypothetical protein
MIRPAGVAFRSPMINIYSHDVMRLVEFYQGLGFHERFRTPKQGMPGNRSESTRRPSTIAP